MYVHRVSSLIRLHDALAGHAAQSWNLAARFSSHAPLRIRHLLPWWPPERSASKQMQMDVEDTLACASICVPDASVPLLIDPSFSRDLRSDSGDRAN